MRLFLRHGGRRTLSANFGTFIFEVCLGGQVVAPFPSIEVSEDCPFTAPPFSDLLDYSGGMNLSKEAHMRSMHGVPESTLFFGAASHL